MNVAEVIVAKLKREGKTKQWLASGMKLSYSTLHQKLDNNTFTAEELVSLCVIFQMDIQNFVESKQKEGLVELNNIPIPSRPDVLIEQMEQYERGGIGIESVHANGSLLYLPYGLQDYLTEHHSLLEGIKNSYKMSAQQMKDSLLIEEEYEDVQKMDNHLHEVSNVSRIIENILISLKER